MARPLVAQDHVSLGGLIWSLEWGNDVVHKYAWKNEVDPVLPQIHSCPAWCPRIREPMRYTVWRCDL
jgi:hypothetical protein